LRISSSPSSHHKSRT